MVIIFKKLQTLLKHPKLLQSCPYHMHCKCPRCDHDDPWCPYPLYLVWYQLNLKRTSRQFLFLGTKKLHTLSHAVNTGLGEAWYSQEYSCQICATFMLWPLKMLNWKILKVGTTDLNAYFNYCIKGWVWLCYKQTCVVCSGEPFFNCLYGFGLSHFACSLHNKLTITKYYRIIVFHNQ